MAASHAYDHSIIPVAQLTARSICSELLRQRVAWKTSKTRKVADHSIPRIHPIHWGDFAEIPLLPIMVPHAHAVAVLECQFLDHLVCFPVLQHDLSCDRQSLLFILHTARHPVEDHHHTVNCIIDAFDDQRALGLIAALAIVRPDWASILGRFATAERDAAVTRATVEKAGAIDGVTALREATVDGFGPEVHAALIGELRRIAWGKTAD